MKDSAFVCVPSSLKQYPAPQELEAAWIIANHYNCLVKFLTPIEGYKIKTADFVIKGVLWELKSPISSSRRRCVSGSLDRASEQSKNIIFDARKTQLDDVVIETQLVNELEKRHSIKRLIMITKKHKIIELK